MVPRLDWYYWLNNLIPRDQLGGFALAQLARGRDGAARIAYLNVLISVTASITPVVAGALVARGQVLGLDALALLFVLSAVGRGASGLVLILPDWPLPRASSWLPLDTSPATARLTANDSYS